LPSALADRFEAELDGLRDECAWQQAEMHRLRIREGRRCCRAQGWRAPARAALGQASVYNFPVLLLKGVFNDRFCVLIPMLRAAPVADPDGNLSSTENIALVTPLTE
jgi:hypothetical protein